MTTAAKGAPLIYDCMNDEYRMVTQGDFDQAQRAAYCLGIVRGILKHALDTMEGAAFVEQKLALAEEAIEAALLSDPKSVELRAAS